MRHKSKRFQGNAAKVDRDKAYDVQEAFELIKSFTSARFDETVEVAISLGIDPKKSDQMVRGFVLLPHGTGRKVRILVFAKGDKEQEAREAGADFVGAEDLIQKIQGGWLAFDKAIATPDMMAKVGSIARILGPKHLLPSLKFGTVTSEVGQAVREEQSGRVEFRADKGGNIHGIIGKLSFTCEALTANLGSLLEQVIRLKPATSKGNYIHAMTLTSTMGPALKLDVLKAQAMVGRG